MPRILFVVLALAALSSPLSASGRAEGSIQKSWEYSSGIASVVVDADAQDIIVKQGPSGVSGRVIGRSGDEVKVSRTGDKLTVTVRSSWSWFSWRQIQSRVELTVAPDLLLDLSTSSGAVLVQVRSAVLKVRTASGDIEASLGGREADVDTASGSVRLKGFSGATRASSLSGDLRLDTLGGAIRAATLSGSLEGGTLSPASGSRFSTVSGHVRVALVNGAEAYRVTAESVSGAVSVAGQGEGATFGSGPTVTVKSVSGDVQVE